MKTLPAMAKQNAVQTSVARPASAATQARSPSPLPHAVSNQTIQRLLTTGDVQAKLSLNTPDDPFEREADCVADQVMRMVGTAPAEPPPWIQRTCSSCAEELKEQPVQRMCDECEEELHRKESNDVEPEMTTAVESQILALQSGGEPLAAEARSFFEQRFDHDFGDVRVHTGGLAADTAQSVNALAYTRGSHIVFGRGQYQTNTTAGRRLLAHELTHVVQQSGGALGRIQRATCPTAPTGIADKPVPASKECTQRDDPVNGATFLFCADSDRMTDASEALLPMYMNLLKMLSVVEVHGYASTDGPAGREVPYNLNLSCIRANRAADMLVSQGIAQSKIRTFKHGGTTAFGSTEQNRVVAIPVPNVHRFHMSAVSMLACAPCNPFSDDGLQAVNPPDDESGINTVRQRHWMSAEILSVDGLHIDPGSPGLTGSSKTLGTSGYCGGHFPAFQVSYTPPSGAGVGISDPVHGEGLEWTSELHSRLGAVVPCTLYNPVGPSAPCGNLGPNTRIPAIGNEFFMRLYADGTTESGFKAASKFPFHYLYERGVLKKHRGSPVHPEVDFHSWTTSTGVSEDDALTGFKALRAACCNPPIGCWCVCRNGETELGEVPEDVPGEIGKSDFLIACGLWALKMKASDCPDPCGTMGTPCDTLTLPANP